MEQHQTAELYLQAPPAHTSERKQKEPLFFAIKPDRIWRIHLHKLQRIQVLSVNPGCQALTENPLATFRPPLFNRSFDMDACPDNFVDPTPSYMDLFTWIDTIADQARYAEGLLRGVIRVGRISVKLDVGVSHRRLSRTIAAS